LKKVSNECEVKWIYWGITSISLTHN